MFKTIFGHLWTAYTYFVFGLVSILASLVAFVVITFSTDKLKRRAHNLPLHGSRLILCLSGMRYKRFGESLDKNGQYIYVANHVNNIDVLYVRCIINTYLKVLAKKEIQKIPMLSYLAKHMAILINRGDKTDRRKGIDEMNKQLKNSGASVLIYPEGTRNKTNKPLLPFKNGAFITAIENQLPIACITLKGIRKRMHPTKWLSFPGSLNAYVDIFETKGLSLSDLDKLKNDVRDKMLFYLSGQQTATV